MSAKFYKLSLNELKEEAKNEGINPIGMSKSTLRSKLLRNSGYSPKRKLKVVKKLGLDGKEGKVFEIKTSNGRFYAQKKFKKNKSAKKIEKEVKFQTIAAKYGISPRIKEYNLEDKYIIMQKLDTNLFDILKKRNGKLSINYQKEIVRLIKKLDEIEIFHKDPNPLNFMLDENKNMFIIDFGFAEYVNVKKHGSLKPNYDQMIIGLLLKLKQFFPGVKYTYLEKRLSKPNLEILNM